MGYLQLTPSQFYELTYDELVVMAEGKRKQDERAVQIQYEVARFSAVYVLQPHLKKGKRISQKDLAVFPWEKNDTLPTPEKIAAARAAMYDEWGKGKKIIRINALTGERLPAAET